MKDLKDICGRGWKIQLRKGKLYAGGQCSTRKTVMFFYGPGLTIRLTIRVFIGLIKLQDQKQSGGGNGLFYLTLPGHGPSINRGNQGRNPGREGTGRQELQHKPWRNAADRLAQLAYILISSGTTSLEKAVAPPT